MKQKIFALSMLAAGLAALAACSEQTEVTPAPQGQPVRLAATAGLAFTRAQDGLLSSFAGGEHVAVLMTPGATGATTQAEYVVGAPAAGTSALTPVADQLVYPNEASVNLYGVWPAASTASHTVQADQKGDDAYRASDLLYACIAVPAANMSQVQTLPFSHQMAKLKVVINKDAAIASVTSVALKGVKRKAAYADFGQTSFSYTAASEGADEISFGPAAASDAAAQTYACVFPAQTITAEDFLTVVTSAGTATYKLTSGTFAAGQVYQLTLNLTPIAMGQTVELTGWPASTATISAESEEVLQITAIPAQTYNGGADVTPDVTVQNNAGETLTKDTDYTIKYLNNKEKGTAYVIVTGKGSYAGLSAIATFTIS